MSRVHTLSIVVPVYRGETCLERLVEAVAPMIHHVETPEGRRLRVSSWSWSTTVDQIDPTRSSARWRRSTTGSGRCG